MKPINTKIIILASQSPRRKALLEKSGLNIVVDPADVDEQSIPAYDPATYAKDLSCLKAEYVQSKHPDNWIIGADTIVVVDELILGKPASKDQARDMLHRLSNREHKVITAFTLCCKAKNKCFTQWVETSVIFKDLTTGEIEWYIDTDEPYDKAGAYAIQGIGAFLVKRINGSYTNVVGIPVCEVLETLTRQGVINLKDYKNDRYQN
ncbi:MAG: septum formation protein Maf [Desulfobacteraceae bacterium]|nr:septum formation protein Maf [Desulfobacteraceae bacterium]